METDPYPQLLTGQPDGALAKAAGWLQVGGPVVVILLGMSVLALAIVVVKLYQFRSVRLGHRHVVRQALAHYRARQLQEALHVADRSPNPVACVLALAIRGQVRRNIPERRVREEVYRVGADYLERLRAYQRPLEVIATLAPLLGLFGTVLGMIEAFQQLQSTGARVDPSILSGGIWKALLTTAVGLAVAMPVIALVNLFDRKLARLAHEMNDAVTQVFTNDLETEVEREDTADVDARVPASAVAAQR